MFTIREANTCLALQNEVWCTELSGGRRHGHSLKNYGRGKVVAVSGRKAAVIIVNALIFVNFNIFPYKFQNFELQRAGFLFKIRYRSVYHIYFGNGLKG
jgi:hypothetical protein